MYGSTASAVSANTSLLTDTMMRRQYSNDPNNTATSTSSYYQGHTQQPTNHQQTNGNSAAADWLRMANQNDAQLSGNNWDSTLKKNMAELLKRCNLPADYNK